MAGSSERHLLIVTGDVVAEDVDEYNRWVSEVHIPEILGLPGFVAGQRFRHSPTQLSSNRAELLPYVNVFEIEGDPASARDAMLQAQAEGRLTPYPPGRGRTLSLIIEPISVRHRSQ